MRKVSKPRNRKYTSCLRCRSRKIKCDRQHPCSSCRRAGVECQFVAPEGKQMANDSLQANELIVRLDSPQPAPGRSPLDIQRQLNELRQELEMLKGSDSMRSTNSSASSHTPELSLLDRPMPMLKKTIVSAKPSRMAFIGTTSRFCMLFFKPRSYYLLLLLGFNQIMKKERRAWKQRHTRSNHAIKTFYDNTDDEEAVIGRIRELVLPNIEAIHERLLYMQTDLNHLLYWDFVPIDMLLSLFSKYFHDGDFHRPAKPYYYADVALITSIAYLVVIFTRYNSDKLKFKYELNCDSNDLVDLSITCLNVSEYRRKHTHQALLTLIVLRNALFAHDNSEVAAEELNSYPIFQLTLDLCIQMGFHRDLDRNSNRRYITKRKDELRTRMLSTSDTKKVWNYMQFQDVAFSLSTGSPLLIDYHFCSALYPDVILAFKEKCQSIMTLFRQISYEVNGLPDLSLNQMAGLRDKLVSLTSTMPFSMFQPSFMNYAIDDIAQMCKVKMMCLQIIQCLSASVGSGLEELIPNDGGVMNHTENETEELTARNKVNFETLILSGCASLYHIKMICEGESIFGGEADNKYLIYFRDYFARIMGQAVIFWFSSALSAALSGLAHNEYFAEYATWYDYIPDSSIPVYEGEVTLNVIESALYGKTDEHLRETLTQRLLTSPEVFDFFTSFYNAVAKNQCMRDSLDSFMMLKWLIACVMLLQTVNENKANGKTAELGQAILDKTEAKLKAFNLGILDERLQVDTDQTGLEKLFNTIFTDKGWSDLESFLDKEKTPFLEEDIKMPYMDGEPDNMMN